MRFLLRAFVAAPLLVVALASENESHMQRLRRQLQVSAKIVNQSSNLGLCEGDCNSNANCRSGLVCWQRNAGDNTPGCSLTSSQRSSRVDFCVARPGGTPTAPTPVRAPTPVASPVRVPTPTGGTNARYVGNDNVSNLQMCQGDCDRDADCASGLKCHQRSSGEGAPGCILGSSMLNSDNDFCVAASSGPTPTLPTPVAAPISSPVRPTPSGNSFLLKMYWEPGYDWQNEPFERKWCLTCTGSCRPDNEISITECEGSPTRWEFVSYGPNEVQIKVANSNICVEEFPDNDLELATCDSSNQKQRFVAFGGSFSDRRFEVSPKLRQGWCMTQRHHPRGNESVNVEPCVTARRNGSNTSYWNKY